MSHWKWQNWAQLPCAASLWASALCRISLPGPSTAHTVASRVPQQFCGSTALTWLSPACLRWSAFSPRASFGLGDLVSLSDSSLSLTWPSQSLACENLPRASCCAGHFGPVLSTDSPIGDQRHPSRSSNKLECAGLGRGDTEDPRRIRGNDRLKWKQSATVTESCP